MASTKGRALPSMTAPGAAQLQQAVVHAQGVEGAEHVFGGVHHHPPLPRVVRGGAHDQVGVGLDHGFAGQVGALNFVAMAHCGAEGQRHGNWSAGPRPEGGLGLQGMLGSRS